MKLFAFQPKGHGSSSAFIIAETKEEAIKHILAQADKYERIEDIESEYYMVTEAEPLVAIFNDND